MARGGLKISMAEAPLNKWMPIKKGDRQDWTGTILGTESKRESFDQEGADARMARQISADVQDTSTADFSFSSAAVKSIEMTSTSQKKDRGS